MGSLLAACGGGSTAPASSAAATPASAPAAASASAKPASAPASAKPAASVSAAASGSAQAAELTKLQVTYTSLSGMELPLFVGLDAGIFRQHGLDVSGSLLQESPAVAALLSGEVQVIQGGGGGTLASAAQGSDLMILSNVEPYFNFLFVVSNSIQTPADLKGKKLGIAPPGGAVWTATRLTLQRLGLNPDGDVTEVAMGVTSQRAAAMESGALDGSILDIIVGQKLVSTGKFHVMYDLAAQKVPYPSTTVARKSWLAGHHDVMQRYIDGLIEAIARTKQDEAFSIATFKKYAKEDDAVSKATYDYFKPLLQSQPLVKAEDLQETAKVMAGANPKIGQLDLNSLIDDSYVQDAIKRGLGK
ncbi:MAG TPA: ABC transporter substrate-binding protein [Chloroflexota bacterium]|nr:ABC transporter substrate-binding protein [Chloroflexota bacterium]